MNANSPKSGFWPTRLQSSCVYLRNLFLISFAAFGIVGLLGFGLGLAKVYPPISLYSNCWALGDALECWFAYKLFSGYASGNWFALQAVRWMQAIGVLSLLRGSLNIWSNLNARFGAHSATHYWNVGSLPLVVQFVTYVQFIFSQLLHNLVFGCVVIFIAWIMDEGRKIQEEQALTV